MISALIVAAGQGLRMGAIQRKQYLNLDGRAILAHTIEAFDTCPSVEQIFLVVPGQEEAYCSNVVIAEADPATRITIVPGGPRRQDSVLNGLQMLTDDDGIVLIHDGVRPFVTKALIEACIQGAKQWGACIPTVAVKDTLKKVNHEAMIEGTVDRAGLHQAQTPQAFNVAIIKKAHLLSRQNNWQVTDDASLVEQMGHTVHTIPGSQTNIKITTPEDLYLAEGISALNKIKGLSGI